MNPLAQQHPDFLLNYDVSDDCPWKYVKVQALPPCCLDSESGKHVGSLFEVVSVKPLLEAAVWDGVFLTAKQCRLICLSRKVTLPGKGQGSGKKRGLIKLDYARSLVNFFYVAESDIEKARMVSAIMYLREGKVDISLLSTVAALDEENAETFKPMARAALYEFTQQIYKRGKEQQRKDTVQKQAQEQIEKENAEKAVKRKIECERNWGLTPNDLKLLLPGGGAISGVFYAQYHPLKGYFRCAYPLDSRLLS